MVLAKGNHTNFKNKGNIKELYKPAIEWVKYAVELGDQAGQNQKEYEILTRSEQIWNRVNQLKERRQKIWALWGTPDLSEPGKN